MQESQAYTHSGFLWIERANFTFYFQLLCARKSAAIYIFQVIFRDIFRFIYFHFTLARSLIRWRVVVVCVIFEPYRYFGQATAVLSELHTSLCVRVCVYVWIESWHCGWQYRAESNWNMMKKVTYVHETSSVNVRCRFISLFFISVTTFLTRKIKMVTRWKCICSVCLLLFQECEAAAAVVFVMCPHEDFSFGDIYVEYATHREKERTVALPPQIG